MQIFNNVKNRANTFLLLLSSLTIVLAGIVWMQARIVKALEPSHVYLIKTGPTYLVAWIDEENAFHFKKFFETKEAFRYLLSDLEVSASCQFRPELKIEKIEMTDTDTVKQIRWKTISNPYVHRLSFQNESDLHLFYNAFIQGSYSPSPFGHSILFLSKKTSQKHCGS